MVFHIGLSAQPNTALEPAIHFPLAVIRAVEQVLVVRPHRE